MTSAIKKTTEEIEKYNKEQAKQLKSVRFHSLLKIQTNLSSIEDFLRGHLRDLNGLEGDLPSQEKYVIDMLLRVGPWSTTIVHMSEELAANLQVIRTQIPPMLHDSIDNCIEGIQILYGVSTNFPSIDPHRCLAAYYFVNHPLVASRIRRIGNIILPFVLIGLGIYILTGFLLV